MATTITVNEVAQCLAKRTLSECRSTSPTCSKRARTMACDAGEASLISPPISTQATNPGEVAPEPEKQFVLQQKKHYHQAQYEAEDDEEEDDDDDDDCCDEDEEGSEWDTRSWNSGILPALPSGLSSSEIRAAREDEACGQSIEDTYKRTLDHFPSPAVTFPSPTLEFDFRIAVALKSESTQVQGRCHKEITAVQSGSWSGSFANGKIMAGGYDLGQARGFRPIRIVEGAFVMQTSDDPPATLEMRTRGSLSGPCDVLDALLSPRNPKEIDCRKYGFRMFLTVKTSDKRYAEIVNCGLWVASGVWRGEELIIDAYRVA